MSVLDPFVIPQDGGLNVALGAGVVAFWAGLIGVVGFILYKFYQAIWPRTVGKITDPKDKNDSQ